MHQPSVTTLIVASSLIAVTVTAAAASDIRDIQMRRLFEPTPAERAQERNGRIYIYESLTQDDIEHAMDAEFDRVESMMFIRVPKTDESGKVMRDQDSGEVITEDDGC
jgi:hypothetical protein